MKKLIMVLFSSLFMLSVMVGCMSGIDERAVEETSEPVEPKETQEVPPTATTEVEEVSIFAETLDEKIPLIFSHDGAPDDIATLIYIAKHPMIDLIGVIQSYGEQHPKNSLEAWQVFLYDVIDYDDALIGVGSEDSIDPEQNEFPEGWREGADNFWGRDLPEASETYSSSDGVDLMINLIKGSPEKVTVLVTGAQTDMALALQKDASIGDNISQIVIMGGAFDVGGNLYESSGYEGNDVAEWNIYVDPLAAKIVFNSGVPLSVVSLDGSDNFTISKDDQNKIKDSNDPAIAMLSGLWEQIFIWWNGDFKIWDIVAGVALTNPEHFEWTYDGVDVIAEPGSTHGQTIRLNNGSEITRFTSGTDYEEVRASIFEVYQ